MQNAVATSAPRGIIAQMAEQYQMDPAAFERTMRATVFPAEASKEEFAAFLMVAKRYKLDPLVRQIYGFKGKGGGIVPIVPIDGWVAIVNDHPEFDGVEFVDTWDKNKATLSITCRMHRHDRSKPIEVTEYLDECMRDTEPWKKWPARMLRHKAYIQCARYAFGIAGVVDEDEAARMVDGQRVYDSIIPLPTPSQPASAVNRPSPQERPQQMPQPRAPQDTSVANALSQGDSSPPSATNFPLPDGNPNQSLDLSDAAAQQPRNSGGSAAVDAAIAGDPMNSKRVATKAQRDMLLALAANHCGLNGQQLDSELADRFAFTLGNLPMALVNEAVQHLNTLRR